MASPKKKLPTGPIRITQPLFSRSEISTVSNSELDTEDVNNLQESRKQDSILQDSSIQESSYIDFAGEQLIKESKQADSNADTNKQESRKQDSSLEDEKAYKSNQNFPATENYLLDLSKQEDRKQDSSLEDKDEEGCRSSQNSPRVESYPLDSSKQENTKQDFSVDQIEYVKVAMRLSATSVERLRGLRNTTGLPYEILVDVMIANWDNLPAKLQKLFLSEAKLARIQRLIAGQDKAMKTVRSKLLG